MYEFFRYRFNSKRGLQGVRLRSERCWKEKTERFFLNKWVGLFDQPSKFGRFCNKKKRILKYSDVGTVSNSGTTVVKSAIVKVSAIQFNQTLTIIVKYQAHTLTATQMVVRETNRPLLTFTVSCSYFDIKLEHLFY